MKRLVLLVIFLTASLSVSFAQAGNIKGETSHPTKRFVNTYE